MVNYFFTQETALVAINFTDKVLVTNPTSFFIGRGVLGAGVVAIILGILTQFVGDFLAPSALWIAFGIPTSFAGWAVMRSGLTKN